MQALIFDMDGVISDTEVLHGEAESQILKRYGVVISGADLSHRFAGVPESVVWPILKQEYHLDIDVQSIMEEKLKMIITLAHGNVRPIPGTLELIRSAQDRHLPLAVASSSDRRFIDVILSELQITSYFSAITSGHEVQHGKPAPDIFLLAAKKLGVDPAHCIVIEDAKSGSIAAALAGMKCIGYKPKNSRQDLSAATVVVDDLQTVTWEMLEQL